ncbi:aldehyde oxidase 3-like [Nomascus leucogenys]|uniref:aldehyde oxidase 3-like n=1 Tax=Nomascus leucogenys TaxID=61853 RepID=UPI00122DA200|nr:aldehyde oxidase 3-like [Nomascus leucogenys]
MISFLFRFYSDALQQLKRRVICVGQIFCTVAADKHAHAKQATKAVKIVYQDVEPIIVNIQIWLPNPFYSGTWGQHVDNWRMAPTTQNI